MSGRDISSNEWGRKSQAYYLNPCEAHSLETNCWKLLELEQSACFSFFFFIPIFQPALRHRKTFLLEYLVCNFVISIRYVGKKNEYRPFAVLRCKL